MKKQKLNISKEVKADMAKVRAEKMLELQRLLVNLLKNYREMNLKLKGVYPLDPDWANAIILIFIENGWKRK